MHLPPNSTYCKKLPRQIVNLSNTIRAVADPGGAVWATAPRALPGEAEPLPESEFELKRRFFLVSQAYVPRKVRLAMLTFFQIGFNDQKF